MKKHSIKVNVILNMVKQICQVIFPLITVPYVTRVLHADNNGKIDFSMSIVSYFTLIAGLGISSYGVLEGSKLRDDRKKLQQFSNEVFTINIGSMLISYLILFIMIFTVPKFAGYRNVLIIQSAGIFFTTVGADWLNTVFEDFKYLTIRYIIFQMIAIILMFMLVRHKSDYLIYAAIMVGVTAGANFLNIFHIRKYVKLKIVKISNLKERLIPILVLFGNVVATTIYVNSDVTLLGFLKNDDKEVGVYSFASKIYTIIKNLINAVIGVVMPRLSNAYGKGEMDEVKRLGEATVDALLLITIPALTGLLCLSREVIWIIGGPEYVGGAGALRVLSLALVFSVLSCLYGSAFLVIIREEVYFLKATIIASLSNIILNFVAIPMWGATGAALTTLIAEAIVFVMSYIKYNQKSKYPICPGKNNILQILIASAGIIAACTLVKAVIKVMAYRLIFSVLLSIAIYFGILLIMKNKYVLESIAQLKKRLKK